MNVDVENILSGLAGNLDVIDRRLKKSGPTYYAKSRFLAFDLIFRTCIQNVEFLKQIEAQNLMFSFAAVAERIDNFVFEYPELNPTGPQITKRDLDRADLISDTFIEEHNVRGWLNTDGVVKRYGCPPMRSKLIHDLLRT